MRSRINDLGAGFSIDPDQGLSDTDEAHLVRLAAELGYHSAWTPSRADAAAFDRCLRWHAASGLPVGISVVPASGQPPEFYAEQARAVWEKTGGRFTLGVGSGQMPHPAEAMRPYLLDLQKRHPPELPLYLAALGPLMLRLAAELADGVALNWCTAEQVAWSRQQLADAANAAGRRVPRVIEYIRTAVDPDVELARRTVAAAALGYALRVPAYRRHFERMDFGEELRRIEATGAAPNPEFIARVAAAGRPGETRTQVERLATGVDLPIVRILVVRRGDVESARRVLEECRPTH
ncbi:MAG TPA: LLM class flavin-dependent oxidoreductase [Candidatus Dormibacteraeota bacterium]|nr:LLM class flavin-dependent oxidoreductase [Candidatus Dormibacteraeota bacterium]